MADARTERWAGHRVEMRRQLAQSAMRAIERIGPQVSMREIAAEAKVPKPTIYRFFKDKADLASAIADQAKEDVIGELVKARQASVGTVGELVNVALTGYAALIIGHPNVFKFLLFGIDSPGGHALENSRAIANEIAKILSTVLEAAGGRSHNVHLYAGMVVGVVTGAADWWMNGESGPDPVDSFVAHVEPAVRAITELAGREAGLDIDFDAPLAGAVPGMIAAMATPE
ncbi:TetR/AcrR family transcriptional regulator [Aldersonia kunmingensis]|uniref:TetR/AcrR family transcriptional regulator n=1 Tax=Aldersonia kunmingensis TaxID=408066 RepID=UPI000AF56A56|nr:TetR/AcrR family transcriptional regulator [Aldersonia kunmingensis]